MVKAYDTVSSEKIKTWQSDIPMQWLWESYQISAKLYTEIKINKKLDEDYFNKHIGIVHQRLEMAAIRLAGVLNAGLNNHPYSNKIRSIIKGEVSN